MGGYANTRLVPQRHFGLAFDLDGALFNFPYLGLETFVGDLAQWDVFGARLLVRPLVWLGVPIVEDLQVGATFAMDVKPYLYDYPGDARSLRAVLYGADIRLPILSLKALSLVATIEGESYGMIGFGGASCCRSSRTGRSFACSAGTSSPVLRRHLRPAPQREVRPRAG